MALSLEKPSDLATHGPLIAVKLWVPKSVQSSWPPIDTLAEINPAYTHTFIQEGVATSLGLQPIGTTRITTATKLTYEAPVFRLRIVFTDSKMSFEGTAVEIPYMLRPNVRVKCLIGRGILRYCIFTYNGPDNTFSLTIPELRT